MKDEDPCLMATAEEQHFYADIARQLGAESRAPAFQGAEWLPDNSKQPYAQWKKDGVVRAMV